MNAQKWTGQNIFEWSQPGKSGDGYELKAGGELVGRLRFEHWARGSAEGETTFGKWKFEQVGFWRPRYLVTEEGTGREVAIYSPRWSSAEGMLETGEGRRFHWGSRRFWGDEHSLVDETGRTVLVLTQGAGKFRWRDLFRQQGVIRTQGPAHDGRTLSILLLFAWWMTLVQAEEAAGAAVVVMA